MCLYIANPEGTLGEVGNVGAGQPVLYLWTEQYGQGCQAAVGGGQSPFREYYYRDLGLTTNLL